MILLRMLYIIALPNTLGTTFLVLILTYKQSLTQDTVTKPEHNKGQAINHFYEKL